MAEETRTAPAYVLSANANRSFLADLEVDASVDLAAIHRSRAPAPPRMTARYIRGAKVPTRIVATSHDFPLLIHESVAEALVNARVGGWNVVPVDLLNARDEAVPGYHLLCIRGRCGALGAAEGRMTFEMASWDGSDLFVADGTTTTLVSPAAHRVFDHLRERHVRLMPVRWADEATCPG
jgi:hypothetical protein